MKIESSNYLYASIAIALGIFLGCMFLGNSIVKTKELNRTINVKGLSERTVDADVVTWPINYKLVGNDLNTIYNNIKRNNDIIVSFLKESGLNDDEISISAPQIVDLQADIYQNNTKDYRYSISAFVTVSSNNVDLVRKIMNDQTSLLKRGVAVTVGDYMSQPKFAFTKLNDIKPDMIEEATKSARSAASKFAKDSDSKLGKISSASQGQFSIYDRDDNTPYIKTVRVVTSVSYYIND